VTNENVKAGYGAIYVVHNLLFSKKNHINFWMTWRCMCLAETIIVWITPAANSVKVIIELPDQLQGSPSAGECQPHHSLCCVFQVRRDLRVSRGVETNRFGIELLLS